MKIALLSEKYTPDIGGLAISTERLANSLSLAGHSVRVLVPSSNLAASETRTLAHNGISVTRFGVHKRVDDTLVHWFELINAEHERSPFDLIHAYFLTQAGFLGTYAAKYLNIPSVVSIRGNDIERAPFDPSKFSHVMHALRYATAVTTNAGILVKKANAFVDRDISLIPNGVDTKHFRSLTPNEALANTLGINFKKNQADGRSIVGFVGELRAKKGLLTLLNGYALLNKKRAATLLIVGELRQGEDKQVFDEFKKANPDHRIIVTGFVPTKELPAYYALMDVFVHPSLRDGMPNAVLEAMACEKAVVATPVGGILELIEDGINGRIVPVEDIEAFAKTVEELCGNSDLRISLGKSARTKILNEFTLEKELNGNLAVYQRLV